VSGGGFEGDSVAESFELADVFSSLAVGLDAAVVEPRPEVGELGVRIRRLAGDYLAVYGHRVLAVETFTDPARHTGACYAAANFVLLGETLGYARSAGR